MRVAILESIIMPAGHEVEFDRMIINELKRQGHEPVLMVPENFTFKTARRNKWYALFMTIPYKSLGLAKAGKVDVLNIKLPPAKIEQLVDRQHFYPAYHMNKKHWLTVMLQKDADISLVQELLAESYQLVEK